MLSEAVEYPTNDEDWVTTVLIGGGLNVAAAIVAFFGVFLFLIPLVGLVLGPLALVVAMLIPIPVGGYLVSVSRTLLEGESVPPAFEEWGDLFVDGVKVALIGLVYFIPWAVIGLFWFLGAVAAGALGNDSGGILFLLFTLVAGLFGLVYAILMWALLPISFVNFARTDRLGAAFDVDALRRTVTDKGYLKAWAIGAVGYLVASMVANSIPIVGLFVVFYAQMSIVYVFTRGAASPLGVDVDFEGGSGGGDGDQSLEDFAASEESDATDSDATDADETDESTDAGESEDGDDSTGADGSQDTDETKNADESRDGDESETTDESQDTDESSEGT